MHAVLTSVVLAMSAEGETPYYVLLFAFVVLGGAGVPMIGTAAVTAAAILASQGTLAIEDVVAVACAAAVLGGIVGYAGGRRWGVELMQHPGRGEERRKRMLDEGHALYVRWGWLACFFVPSFIAGVARMRFAMFLIFNTIAAVVYQFATALPAYGAGKVISGHSDTESLFELAAGVVLAVLVFWRIVLPRRRRRAERKRPAVTS
jgi:membrane-associated protein